jgi:hypothetical protein
MLGERPGRPSRLRHAHARLSRDLFYLSAMSCSRNNGYALFNSTPNPPLSRGLTLGRLNQAEGGRYALQNLSSALYEERTDSSKYLKFEVWPAPGRSKPTFQDAVRASYRPIHKGHKFGPSWVRRFVLSLGYFHRILRCLCNL